LIEELREQKLGEIVVDIQAAARGWAARNRYRKLTQQSQAAKVIQRNLRAHFDLREWNWWLLWKKAKPLITQVNFEEEISKREKLVQDYTKKSKDLEEEKNKLETQLAETSTSLTTLKKKFAEKEELANELEDEKRRLESERSELKRKLEDLEADIQEAESSLAGLITTALISVSK